MDEGSGEQAINSLWAKFSSPLQGKAEGKKEKRQRGQTEKGKKDLLTLLEGGRGDFATTDEHR